MSRQDDVNELYRISGNLGNLQRGLFVANIIASVVTLVSNQTIVSIAIIAQIVVTIVYFVCNIVDDGICWYNAEKERRKSNIQNAFDIRLSEYETNEYYNNDISPSVRKHGLNTLESNYFSKIIAGKMIPKSGIATVLSIVVLLIACRFLKSDEVLLIIAQTVFSAYILMDSVILIIYKMRMEVLYDEAYNAFVSLGAQEQEAWILSYVIEYEAIKAHYKVRLDTKLFLKYNDDLSQKWQKILKHIMEKECTR